MKNTFQPVPGCWQILGAGLLAVALLVPAMAQASPLPWNPFSVTMRGDNTMTVRGTVTQLAMDEPLGGCTFELHHSESLPDVQVVLDATRGRDCRILQRKLVTILDPALARVIVKAKGRVVVTDTGEGIGPAARDSLAALLNGIDCTTTKGAAPSLALDPLQRVKEEVDKAAKRIPDGALALAQVRAVLVTAQDDLEQAAALTGSEPVCNVTGLAEIRKALEQMPAASRQTLHATGVQVSMD